MKNTKTIAINQKSHSFLIEVQELTEMVTSKKMSLSTILNLYLANAEIKVIKTSKVKTRKQRSDKGVKKVMKPGSLKTHSGILNESTNKRNKQIPDKAVKKEVRIVPQGLSNNMQQQLINWCMDYNYSYNEAMKLLGKIIIEMPEKNEAEIAEELMKRRKLLEI